MRTSLPTLLSAALLVASGTGAVARESERPRFDRVVLLEETAETSANVAIGDIDGDGFLDVVLAKGRHWPLVDRVLFGDGKGGFPRARDLGRSDRTYSGRLADLDGDGDLDIVLSNDHHDPKLVYRNDGKGRGRALGRAERGVPRFAAVTTPAQRSWRSPLPSSERSSRRSPY
ncbi:MAG TPA: FG-GAP-like repeat-containing protein [Thermoanaerobaculia bacterium]|nr:FG-GAP-like repeat-containing protein [Thermoanaerobaculia bacterium]